MLLQISLVLLLLCFESTTQAAIVKKQLPAASSHSTVIVVGAGPAGIAAASRLHQHGVDVQLFEAESRYGGRVHSVHFGDAMVDLGAEWCHGENNIVYELMKDADVLRHPNYTWRLFSSDGMHVDDEFNAELHAIFDDLYATDGGRNSTEEDTVGSYFTKVYYDTIRERYGNNRTKFGFAQMAYHTFNKYVLSGEGAFSWFDPSALSDYKDCDGDHTLTWNGLGYKTVLDKLLINFDMPRRMHLGREVKHIVVDDQQDMIDVELLNGDVHTASHVIFTPSLGVLKANYKTMFSPVLSTEKATAIEAIGIGAVMKVMVHYPERWWSHDEDFSGFSFVWTQEDYDTLAVQFRRGPQKLGVSWLSNFFGAYRLEKNPNALSCWFTGEFVPEIELLDDETLIDGITFTLKKFLGHAHKVQRPDAVARSKWYANEHFRGTYSYQTIASRAMKRSANMILGQPIENSEHVPKLLFAGEATHPFFYSTVHGAISSGFREADRLINLLK